MRLYGELAEWFHHLTHPSDYEDEARDYARFILDALPGARTMLELGSGGGNNASHMKQHFEMTLTDLSEEMLALSRTINPELEHIQGDMRTLRLGRTFDAVFVHDAISFMLTAEDLAAAITTAFVHTRPGGVALFATDGTLETFEADTDHGGHDLPDGRSLRYLEWSRAPTPGATEYETDYALLLREGDGSVRVELDRQQFGVFPHATWVTILEGAGFELLPPPDLDPEVHEEQVVFVCRRPG